MEQEMRSVFGDTVEEVLHEQADFLGYTPASWQQLIQHIIDSWDKLQAVAALVPPSAQMREWMRQAGASLTSEELGLTAEDVALARQYAHYVRNRFTIAKLRQLLEIE
jgi:glycerol dehydrogenase-like iron-containing ADH family enzyme